MRINKIWIFLVIGLIIGGTIGFFIGEIHAIIIVSKMTESFMEKVTITNTTIDIGINQTQLEKTIIDFANYSYQQEKQKAEDLI